MYIYAKRCSLSPHDLSLIEFIRIVISTLSVWWIDTKYVTQFSFLKRNWLHCFKLTQGRNSWENTSVWLNKCTCSIQCIIFYKLMLSIIPQFMKFKYIHPFITGDDSKKKNTLLTFQNLFLQNPFTRKLWLLLWFHWTNINCWSNDSFINF